MKDSGVEWIGQVPEEWSVGRLRNFSQHISTGPFGTALGTDDYIESGVPVINPSHISSSRCAPDSSVTVSQETAARLTFWAMQPGDIVTARRGELGRAAIVTDDEAGWICGTGSIRITPDRNRADSGFIHAVLQSGYARRWLEYQSVGSTMPNLSERLIGDLPMAIPSNPDEQKLLLSRATDEQNRIDALIDKAEQSITLLKERRAAFITAAVTGQIDLRGEQ
ncbi:restriction endonuclease subunit S [Salmonella enterica]